MELFLTRPDATASQVTVTCDGQQSHSFDLSTLFPTKANGLPHPIADPAAYGAALYAALFPQDSLAHKALAQERERLLLVATDETLDAVPWEYLHGPDGFVVCDLPFVRGLPPEQRVPTPELMGNMHILAVPSNPLHPRLAPLNIEGEWMRLRDSVQGVATAVTLERVWPPTIERLRALVANQQQRVVHFMGHGGKNEREEAVLCFERDNGTLERISAREFTKRLRSGVFLVTLNACVSAEPGETPFSNLAAALVRERVPYALGMRFSIHDEDALTFSWTFYDNLARGVPVEEAVFQMRLSLVKSARPWAIGVPVLYTALAAPAPGFASEPGTPVVQNLQEVALRAVIGVLPQTEGAFQGRLDEQITLGDALTGNQRPRLLTIHGSGGQGKTALARVAVERFAHAWSGGVWAISLESLPTRAEVVADLARFLGIDVQGIPTAGALEQEVLRRLRLRRTLLVLDNAETLVEAARADDAGASEVAAFLQQLPGASVSLLVTSRDTLGWSGEVSLELGGLSPEDGATLFEQSAPQRSAAIEAKLAQQLSRRLEGHPFGLILLGKAFNAISLSLSAFIADYETFLLSATNQYVGLSHRQRTLYANVEYSTRYLPPDLRSLLSKLWLFHAPFQPEAATAILDSEQEKRETGWSTVADQLHALWQRGLLSRNDGRLLLYQVQPVLRPYLETYLADTSEREILLARFGMAYHNLAFHLYDHLDRSGIAASLALQCREDLDRGVSHVSGIARGYYLLHWGRVLHRLGDPKQGLALAEQAFEITQEQDQKLASSAMNNMALGYHMIGQPRKALRLYEQVLPIDRKMGDRAGEAAILNNMGLVYEATGQPREALRLFEQALPIRREVGDRIGEANTLNSMAAVYKETGQPREALHLLERALPIMKEVGDRAGEAAILNNMAGAYKETGQRREALRLLKQALPITKEVGNRVGEAATLNGMAGVYQATGQPREALHLLEQALSIRREVGDRAGEAATLNNIAELYRKTGQPREALHLLEQALPIRREVGDRAGEAVTLNNMGLVYEATGQLREALRLYEQALPIIKEVGDRTGEANTLNNIAELYRMTGQL